MTREQMLDNLIRYRGHEDYCVIKFARMIEDPACSEDFLFHIFLCYMLLKEEDEEI